MRSFISGSLLLAVAVVVGCSQTKMTESPAQPSATSTVSTANEYCPIMGSEVTADGGTTEWNGQTIGFCCDGCIDKFEALSDDEKTAALAKAAADHDEHAHGNHDHGDHDHGDHDHGDESKSS